ncbi:hypothetical protein HYH02_005025 [Chlamydomonas schloesseri]|uniref:Uncharacterized protein n=1 Tax=Chlamydomonas schloesseri TaxID=2026947 RepID=A0A835WMH6_9CHLO|nr:hypothetical protein HYH02_005025 [Chlamydomonas schloesseri]|eukprot:KAG2450524.1 hypothetical protein HYH02_005025 [Chlamydomonas schloesseri]
MPPESALRAAAMEGRPDVGPPPRLPHQLSPALQAVLLGWRSLYEQCRSPGSLQALVGECYAPGAVFEDALVSAAGQEALYRQFALLGAAVRAVQVGAYSLSVAPLAQPAVTMRPPPPPSPGRSAFSDSGGAKGSPPRPSATAYSAGSPTVTSTSAAAVAAARQGVLGQSAAMSGAAGTGAGGAGGGAAGAAVGAAEVPLHLTRVTVENVQCFVVTLPPLVSWLLGGGKEVSVQIPLYVTSVLLVASDAPLAHDGAGGADTTASRLASAAAALGESLSQPASFSAATYSGGGGGPLDPLPEGGSSSGGAAPYGGGVTHWRILHHLDRWHNVPLVWWVLRRAAARAVDAVLVPLLLRRQG